MDNRDEFLFINNVEKDKNKLNKKLKQKIDINYLSLHVRLESIYHDDREILELINKIPRKVRKLEFLKELTVIGFNKLQTGKKKKWMKSIKII